MSTSAAWDRYRAGEYEVALALFEAVLAGDGRGYSALIGRGRCQRMLGQIDEAIETFTQTFVLHPEQARPMVERGALYVLQERWADAAEDYQVAYRLDPHYPGFAAYVAELELYTGRPQHAHDLSVAALGREPDNLMHSINLAHSLLLLGYGTAARLQYEEIASTWHPQKRASGAAIAANDLRLMRAAGLTAPGFDDIEVMLTRRV
ncbi:tetratricopeptide repeat protein [Rhodococcus sp. NPDC127530]|uniref:tetratricopeptide repeat protein n=1 Tax=unclassified Rhodococcus (in: high G+C Gram-positive bacteria) TaxID=192944 RepID=UPI0036373D2B